MKEHDVLSIVLRDNLHQPQVSTGIHITCVNVVHSSHHLVCREAGENIEILY